MINVSAGFKAKRATGKFPFNFRAELYLPIEPVAATASGYIMDYPPAAVIDGDRTSLNAGPAASAHNYIGQGVWQGGGMGALYYEAFNEKTGAVYGSLVSTDFFSYPTSYDNWTIINAVSPKYGPYFGVAPAYLSPNTTVLTTYSTGAGGLWGNGATSRLVDTGTVTDYIYTVEMGTRFAASHANRGEIIIGAYSGGVAAANRDTAIRLTADGKIYFLNGTVQSGPYNVAPYTGMPKDTKFTYVISKISGAIVFTVNGTQVYTGTSGKTTIDRQQINCPVAGGCGYDIASVRMDAPGASTTDYVVIQKSSESLGRLMLYGMPDSPGMTSFYVQRGGSATGPWTTIKPFTVSRAWEKWNGSSTVTVAADGKVTLASSNLYPAITPPTPSVVELHFSAITDAYLRIFMADTGAASKRAKLCEVEMFEVMDITKLVNSYEVAHSADVTLSEINARTLSLEMKNAETPPEYSYIKYPLLYSEDFEGTTTGLRPELSIWEAIDSEYVQVGYFALDEPTLDPITRSISITGRSRYEAAMYDRPVYTYLKDTNISDAAARALECVNVPAGMYHCEPYWATLRRFVPKGTARPVIQTLREAAQDTGIYVDGVGGVRNSNVQTTCAPLLADRNDIDWDMHNDSIFWDLANTNRVYYLKHNGTISFLPNNLYSWDITKPFSSASLCTAPITNTAIPTISCQGYSTGGYQYRWFFPGYGVQNSTLVRDEVAVVNLNDGTAASVWKKTLPFSGTPTDERVTSCIAKSITSNADRGIAMSAAIVPGTGAWSVRLRGYDFTVGAPSLYDTTIAISSAAATRDALTNSARGMTCKLVLVGTTVYLIAGPVTITGTNTGVRVYKVNNPWTSPTLTLQTGTLTYAQVTDVKVESNVLWMTTCDPAYSITPAMQKLLRWDTTQAISTVTSSAALSNSGTAVGVKSGIFYYLNQRTNTLSALETWDGAASGAALGTDGAAAYNAALLALGPVAYWKLNNTAGTNEDNAEGTAAYDGTWSGAPAFAQPGLLTPYETEKSTLFTGSAICTIPAETALSPDGNSFTVAFWFYHGGVSNYEMMYTNYGIANTQNGYEIRLNPNGHLNLYKNDISLDYSYEGGTKADDGVRHFVVLTYDVTTGKGVLYLDNAVELPSFDFGVSNSYAPIFYLGKRGDGYNFSGYMEKVAFFHSCLTPTDIAALWAAGNSGVTPVPAGEGQTVQISVLPTGGPLGATIPAYWSGRWIGAAWSSATFWHKYPILCDRGTGPMALIMLDIDPTAVSDNLALGTTEALKEKMSFELAGQAAQVTACQFTLYNSTEQVSTVMFTEGADSACSDTKLVELAQPIDPATIVVASMTLVRKGYRYPLVRATASGGTIKGTIEVLAPISLMIRPANATTDSVLNLNIDTQDNQFVWNPGHATNLARVRLRRSSGPTHWFDGEMVILPHLELGDYITMALPLLGKTYTLQLVSTTHAVDISEDSFTARSSVELVERTLQ